MTSARSATRVEADLVHIVRRRNEASRINAGRGLVEADPHGDMVGAPDALLIATLQPGHLGADDTLECFGPRKGNRREVSKRCVKPGRAAVTFFCARSR